MEKRVSQGVDPGALDGVVRSLGVRVRIWHSTVCPNMTSLESMDHDINCTACNNNMIDFDCFESMALFQQQDMVDQFKLQGTFHVDKILVTFLSGITLQSFTKVELLDFREDFFELIQRQEGTDVDLLKYHACEVLGLFEVSGSQKIRYHHGTDFTLDGNGSVKWIGTHRPDDRKVYTIYYKYHPVFRSIEAVHRDRYSQYNLRPDLIKSEKKTVNGNTFVKLPETWVLKRDYLLERKDKAGNPLTKNVFYDPNEP